MKKIDLASFKKKIYYQHFNKFKHENIKTKKALSTMAKQFTNREVIPNNKIRSKYFYTRSKTDKKN